ncbi:PTS sugar transporter subunit IIA [Succinatimonas hippei]|uniref:PTS sugar transporter subunit IIA n=1 Tax=Succinatimonas hippei TaxID=626938 RepID=UPI0025D39785|nr:PTS sugar transporter subunit IIA [Succinatimonas hippei]
MLDSFEFLPDTLILSPLSCFSKKRLFEDVADQAAFIIKTHAIDINMLLNDREKCGSTALDNGVAIPHIQMNKIEKTFGILSILQNKVFFNDVDTDLEDADIVYTFFFSQQDDPKDAEIFLKNICEIFENEDLCVSLRRAKNEPDTISTLLKKIDLQLGELQQHAKD